MVSETVRQQILDRQRRMAAAEHAPEMSKPQTAALQRDIAAILLPGESVTKALQRLGRQDKRPAGGLIYDCLHAAASAFGCHTCLESWEWVACAWSIQRPIQRCNVQSYIAAMLSRLWS